MWKKEAIIGSQGKKRNGEGQKNLVRFSKYLNLAVFKDKVEGIKIM